MKRDSTDPRDSAPTLPNIEIVVGKPHEAIAQAINALRADPDLYARDTDLVHVTRVTPEAQQESAWVDGRGRNAFGLIAGSPTIYTMTLATLRIRMCQRATWVRKKPKKDGGFKQVRCEPTRGMAEELRDEKHWPGIRPLVGVSETPFPRPDLTIVQGPAHYDKATGYLYQPSQRFLTIPDRSTRDDARRSREALEDLFVDFPFAHAAGLSAVVAMIVTLICRPAIKGPVPAGIIDAASPGTGKTMLADCVSAIGQGREAGRTHFPSVSGRDGDAELGKRIGMLARIGAPLVCFDNADDCIIGGDVLEEVISARERYLFRILGKSEGLNLFVRMLFLVTANNASWSRGMNRRILHIRLQTDLVNPEHRPLNTYKHPERAGCLFEYAMEHRAEYVRHALTIVRAYAAAGCPDPLTLGTFEAWAALVPSALVWAGGVNPMLCRPSQSGEESPDTMQRATLAREWSAFCRDTGIPGMSAHDMIARLYPPREYGAPPPPADPKWDALRGAIEYLIPPRQGQSPDPAKLGDKIGKAFRGAPIQTDPPPAPPRRFMADGTTGGRTRWKVVDVVPSSPGNPEDDGR